MENDKNIIQKPTVGGSNFASGSNVKGKGIAKIDITKSLDLVIKDNEELSVNLASNSKRDLKYLIEKNQFYKMRNKEWEQRELAKDFTGLDKILFDRLVKKAGTNQTWYSGHQSYETKFKVNEVKEIVNELGIISKNDNTELLKNIKLAVVEQERKHREELDKKEELVEKGRQTLQNQKNQLQTETDARKKAEAEKETESSQLKKEIENLTQQLEALTKAYNEETVERQKLEIIAKETAERINNNSLIPDLTKIELHEAKNTITQLSQTIEAQRGIITAGKISLESREKKIEDWKKTLEDVNQRHNKEIDEKTEKYNKLLDEKAEKSKKLIDKEHELETLKLEFFEKERDLENAEARLNRADTEIINRGKEITEWKNKAEINEANCRDAKIAADQLRNQLREAEQEKEPTWYQKAGNWIGEKTGFTAAKNAISNVLNIVIIVLLFYGFSLLWKHLIKPTLANFKSDKKKKEEPKSRKKQPVRYDDYEEVLEAKKEPQPLIEKEIRKPVVVINEPVNQREISSEKETANSTEKTDPKISEPQESKKAPKKRKNSQKKTKKKIKGDSG